MRILPRWLIKGMIAPADPTRQAERDRMVNEQVLARGLNNQAVLRAMRRVPRHEFIPEAHASLAYEDQPVPIGHGQTISQPAVVAYMTSALGLTGSEKVLEVGTGSGYQAAVLAEIVPKVYTIEIVAPLAERAAEALRRLGYTNVQVRVGDGAQGWPEEAPFDAIIVTAASAEPPQPLLDQLAAGGRFIAPIGTRHQALVLIRRTGAGYERTELVQVMFVPLTGPGR
jgi:protein-L-isoaspartate(D-aspartate) O-methyltransferase